ncbi:glycosyltransferase family 2 protein [Rhizobium sp. P32RR-XVIII]|uniref:glycosyltransferase family 2 protein n=1 Tax=Rhizobium sp. P32RR-XVIII TaxID=2726738 RepID=UPI001FEF91C4|nr:glycosyltransferase family A protein [Rhizobium sp. P32RR-XVIII]
MMEATVAVVIPYYNGSRYIERSVASVYAQTLKPSELVVVDDGSTAEEASKLDEIAFRMGFTVLRKENGGQGSARNYGVAHTQSQFICFLDQDDFFIEYHIEVLLDAVPWTDPQFGWVYGDVSRASDDGKITRAAIVKDSSKHPKRNLNDLIARDLFVLPSAALINRQAFEGVGGFDSQFTGYEDDDLFLRIFKGGYTNHFVDCPVTVWCMNTNSTSFSILMSRSRLKYVKKLCALFPDDPDSQTFYIRDLISKRFTRKIMRDARRALTQRRSPQELRMAQHKEELIEIVDDYVRTITAFTTVPWTERLSLKAQAAVLRTQATPLIKVSFAALNVLTAPSRIFRNLLWRWS